MPITVVYDYQIFSWQQYGGISRYFYETANRIAGLDSTHVEICSPVYVTSYFDAVGSLHPRGVKIPHLSHSGRIIGACNAILSRFLVKNRTDVDIFHETYYSGIDNCPSSAKRIITVCDMTHEKFPQNFLKRDKTAEIKARAVKRADHVICISESTKKDLMAMQNVPEEKISVVYLGCSLALSNQPFANPSLCRQPYILYVGVRGGYKNFDRMLRAYAASARLKDQFSLVCFGGGPFNADEQAIISTLGLTPDSVVQMSGSDDLLAQLYANAALFVCPSLYEGFGIPPLEAMAFGCPVACSNTSSLPEVVGDAAELFDPTDIAAMGLAMEKVVLSAERSRQLVALGQARIKLFSWEKCAADTLAVYKKVLQG